MSMFCEKTNEGSASRPYESLGVKRIGEVVCSVK